LTSAEYNITLVQGASWRRTFTVDDGATVPVVINITGCSIRSQIRKRADSTIIVDMNTPDEIVLTDPTNGQFEIFISSAVTSLFPKGLYKWDLFIKWPNGDVDRWWYGEVELEANITEPSTNA
jgi:hypothetical protein